MPETRTKATYIFLIMNHSITESKLKQGSEEDCALTSIVEKCTVGSASGMTGTRCSNAPAGHLSPPAAFLGAGCVFRQAVPTWWHEGW